MAANNFSTRNMGHDVSDQPRLSNGQFTFKGSATAATMPYHRQQTALEAPMPVSQNAPLEERMYPASVADVVKKARLRRPFYLATVFARPGCGCSLLSHGGERTRTPRRYRQKIVRS